MDTWQIVAAIATALAALATSVGVIHGMRQRNQNSVLHEQVARLTRQASEDQIQNRASLQDLGSQIDDMREYATRTAVIQPERLHVLLTGPRAAGKTTLCRALAEPWLELRRTAPTLGVETHDVRLHESDGGPCQDPVFAVERSVRKDHRLTVWDVGGERAFIRDAFDLLQPDEDTVVALAMPCSFGGAAATREDLNEAARTTAQYYSHQFYSAFHSTRQIRNVSSAVVIFTKLDLLPASWHVDHAYRESLQALHADSLQSLCTTVGPERITYAYVSAYSGLGVADVLGDLASGMLVADVPDSLPSDVAKHIARAERPHVHTDPILP